MKLLIAADMEGVTGVVNWNQVTAGQSEYERFRQLMTEDVNAAIQGAYEARADEVIVADGHASAINILIEKLDSRATLNCGSSSPFSMVQGISNNVDGVFFIGYHAHAGTSHAILDHTWSSKSVANVWLNRKLVGEIGLNASLCGHFGIPVLMISGDQSACDEASVWIPGIETAAVKTATGRTCAECLTPAQSHKRIREAAARGVHSLKEKKSPVPLEVDKPVTIEIEFFSCELVDRAVLLPGVKRLEPRRIEVISQDMISAYHAFMAAVMLANASC